MEDNGMGNSWVLIILFALIFGGNGLFGNRTGEFGQYATAASQQEILFGQQFQGLDNKIDRIGNGIADATFALNNAITGDGRNIQLQMASGNLENLRNVDALRFDIASMNAGLAAAIHGEGEQTRALINSQEVQRLRDELAQSRAANADYAQSQYILGQIGRFYSNPPCNPCGTCCNG